MNTATFLSDWASKYRHIALTARDVSASFGITSSAAAAMLAGFVAAGACTARYYTRSRVTVYTLSGVSA